MIFKKKKMKQVKAVIMLMESGSYGTRTKRYEVPCNGSAKVSSIGNELYIFDVDGNKVLEVNPQAGFTVEFTFEYE